MTDGLERARNASIPTAYREPKFPLIIQWSTDRYLDNLVKYKKLGVDEQLARSEYDRDLAQLVLRDAPDLVICAGWMHGKQASLCNESGVCSVGPASKKGSWIHAPGNMVYRAHCHAIGRSDLLKPTQYFDTLYWTY